MTKNSTDLYARLIETIFHQHYQPGGEVVRFTREELVSTADELGLVLPKNLGDVVYSFKFRRPLPSSILEKAPENKHWVIVNKGRGLYAFETRTDARILPDPLMTVTKIPDATPGIVAKYALNDEQALLTKLRYNRLIDIFTGVTCYSLQNHLRTTRPYQTLDRLRRMSFMLALTAKANTTFFLFKPKVGAMNWESFKSNRISRYVLTSSQP